MSTPTAPAAPATPAAPAAPTAPAEPTAPAAAAAPTAPTAPATPTAPTAPAAPAAPTNPDEAPLENLLDTPATAATSTPAEPTVTDEAIGEFLKGIPALDLGKDAQGKPIVWSDGALKAVAPAMIAQKLTQDQAKAVVFAYVEYAKAQNAAQVKAAREYNAHLIADAKQKFGPDLPRFAREADAGGRSIFGDEIWNEMRTITAFSNDPRIIERLAAVGRGVQTDPGADPASPAGNHKDDLAERWLKTSV